MSDIRFSNQPVDVHREPETVGSSMPSKKRKMNKKYLWFLIALVLIVVGLKYGSGLLSSSKSENGNYYAVFLTNSQVYFGKMADKSGGEMELHDVYYLSVSGSTATATPASFQLLKLGNEIHGPTDLLYLNMDHVVFYEELRADSAVVKKIQENKQ